MEHFGCCLGSTSGGDFCSCKIGVRDGRSDIRREKVGSTHHSPMAPCQNHPTTASRPFPSTLYCNHITAPCTTLPRSLVQHSSDTAFIPRETFQRPSDHLHSHEALATRCRRKLTNSECFLVDFSPQSSSTSSGIPMGPQLHIGDRHSPDREEDYIYYGVSPFFFAIADTAGSITTTRLL